MSDFLQSLFAFLVFILDVIAIIDVISGPKDLIKKGLWTLFILVMPVLGLAVYYFFGRQEFRGTLKPQ